MTDPTESIPPLPAPADAPAAHPPLRPAAGLATEVTARLTAQLGTVRLHAYGPSAPTTPAPPTLVAVAHGSRDPRAVGAVRALLDRVRALRPGLPVRLGHLELNRPLLADTLDALTGEVVLVPLLFGRGHHVTHDLPAALAAAPHLTGTTAPPLGPHALLAEALHGRLKEAGFDPGAHGGHARPRRPAVILAAAGSRSARSADDTARTAHLLSGRLGGLPVLPAFASAAGPTVAEAARMLTARGHDHLALASCFTAPGRFATQCAAAAPGPAAAPLGDHPALARLVLHRYDQVLLARSASDPHGTRAATVAV